MRLLNALYREATIYALMALAGLALLLTFALWPLRFFLGKGSERLW